MNSVLVVDDREENLLLLEAVLKGNGYTVARAGNGAEALQAARERPPDLVISDIFMPVMDGFALCREWNQDARLQRIPFVFYTATYTDARDEELGLSLGAARFLAKGMEPEAFVAAVREVLLEYGTGRLAAPERPATEEAVYYRLYNEALVRKLEEKMLALERDMDERQRVEESLRQSEEEFRAMFNTASVGMAQADIQTGQWLRVNRRLSDITGYTAEELLGLRVSEITHPEDREWDWNSFQRVVRGEAPEYRLEKRYVRKDGSVVWVNVNMTVVRDAGGQATRTMAVIEDITARKRAEAERDEMEARLRQQQKLEAIGTLAGGVAHEINNPVTGIMNYAQLIGDAAAAGGPTAEYAREIVQECERVATIVRSLLQFARQEKRAHSPARLQDILEQTLSLLRAVFRRDQIAILTEVPEDLPPIKCRSQQIQQVLTNLLTNARDALNERYPGHHPDKTIQVSVRPLEREGRLWLRITVSDRGIGIPAAIRERIFEPFFTTKPRDKGTGLGLSISHGIVMEHGGRLWVESKEGQWTQFLLELPTDNGWKVESTANADR